MLSKNTIKLIKQLEQKKFRKTHNLFVVEGEKMVEELVNSSFKIKEIFALNNFAQKLKTKAFDFNITTISETELLKISKQKTPNKVLALAFIPNKNEVIFDKNKLYLALDNVQDPGNLGTIIRSANWFGIDTIFCSTNTADAYNHKVVQATMGALFNVNIEYNNLKNVFEKAKKINIPIIGTSLSGDNMYKNNLPKNGIVIMGNESKGMRTELEQFVDVKIKIPNYNNGNKNIESLNVAVATSIILAEIKRKY